MNFLLDNEPTYKFVSIYCSFWEKRKFYWKKLTTLIHNTIDNVLYIIWFTSYMFKVRKLPVRQILQRAQINTISICLQYILFLTVDVVCILERCLLKFIYCFFCGSDSAFDGKIFVSMSCKIFLFFLNIRSRSNRNMFYNSLSYQKII